MGEKYSKKICMSELCIEEVSLCGPRFYESCPPRQDSSLTFLYEGSGKICTVGSQIEMKAGELLYLPEGEHYDILWSGDNICFIRIRIISRKFDLENTKCHSPRIITSLSKEDTGSLFRQIHQLFSTENRVEKIRAVGLYYLFYASLLPELEEKNTRHHSLALREAIFYIETHFAEDFSMEKLAHHISLSPSRMFHLFQKELGTSPVRYRNHCRMEHAACDLRSTDLSLSEIAERNGLPSPAYFRELFKKHTGKTPLQYRADWRK